VHISQIFNLENIIALEVFDNNIKIFILCVVLQQKLNLLSDIFQWRVITMCSKGDLF